MPNKAETPEQRFEREMEQRAKDRAGQLEALAAIINPIIETTQGEVSIDLDDNQTGTALDGPDKPLVWGLTVRKGFAGPALKEIPQWHMQGQFNEVVCFLHGFQTALMLLAAMVEQPTIVTPGGMT